MAHTSSTSKAGPWLAAATVLGVTHAVVSLLWALGATWWLDTVGGQIEEWARDGGATVRAGLLGIVAAKLLAVTLPWRAVRRGGRTDRLLAWTAGAVLVVYGGVFTGTQALALAGAIDLADDVDLHALRWHTYLWDPWFLLWGLCIIAALRVSRPRRRPASPQGS